MLRRGVGALAVGGAGFAAYKALAPKGEEKDFGGGPLKKKIQRFNSLVERGQNPQEIKTRAEMIKSLKAGELFDVIIVGAGCTGAGTALDCAARGLKTACIERGDFSNETSSRSSKLIWGGFKYLQVAFAELLNRRTLYEPISSVQKFWGEFLMVYECCQERTWLAGQQPHLVEYVPQAVRGSSPAHGGISFSAEPAAGPAPPPCRTLTHASPYDSRACRFPSRTSCSGLRISTTRSTRSCRSSRCPPSSSTTPLPGARRAARGDTLVASMAFEAWWLSRGSDRSRVGARSPWGGH